MIENALIVVAEVTIIGTVGTKVTTVFTTISSQLPQ
jgi:Flp pilus assembly pilin Flp